MKKLVAVVALTAVAATASAAGAQRKPPDTSWVSHVELAGPSYRPAELKALKAWAAASFAERQEILRRAGR